MRKKLGVSEGQITPRVDELPAEERSQLTGGNVPVSFQYGFAASLFIIKPVHVCCI